MVNIVCVSQNSLSKSSIKHFEMFEMYCFPTYYFPLNVDAMDY